MNTDVYESTLDHMSKQVAFLEELIERPLTPLELDNLKGFFDTLPELIQSEFTEVYGSLV